VPGCAATGPALPSLANGICTVRQHPWQLRVVRTSRPAHHMVMNESPTQGQQPADNPRPWLRRPGPVDPGLPGTRPPIRRPHELLQSRQQQPSGRASWHATSPDDRRVQVRIVWDGRTGEIEGVRVRNPDGRTYTSVRPTERLAADVRQAFAHFLAEDIVAAVWHVPSTGTGLPASSAELLTIAEELLDPRLLAAELVRITVQVAAVHAGLAPIARVMGQAAQDLFTSLLGPDPEARKVQAVQYADLTLSAEDGSVIFSPSLPEIADSAAADVIDKLLSPDNLSPGARNRPSSPSKAIREPVGPAEPPTTPGLSHPVPSPSNPTSVPSHPAQGPSKPSPAEIDHPKPGGFVP
jgi:hypothetical protein